MSALAYGAQDNAYLVGGTNSPDFPITPNAYEAVPPGPPTTTAGTFITKINIDPGGLVLTRSRMTLGPPGSQPNQYSLIGTVTPLTFAAAEPVPTGTVTFANKGTVVGTAPLSSTSPIASLTTTFAAASTSFGCTYSGDTYYANSTCTIAPDYAFVLASPTTLPSSLDTAHHHLSHRDQHRRVRRFRPPRVP